MTSHINARHASLCPGRWHPAVPALLGSTHPHVEHDNWDVRFARVTHKRAWAWWANVGKKIQESHWGWESYLHLTSQLLLGPKFLKAVLYISPPVVLGSLRWPLVDSHGLLGILVQGLEGSEPDSGWLQTTWTQGNLQGGPIAILVSVSMIHWFRQDFSI